MFSFLNAESKSIVSAAAIIGALSFASRFVGLIRDRILAGAFGAGNTLDVYYAAFKLPDFTFSLLVVGALSASFIPLFAKYYFGHADRARAWKLTNNVLHVIVLVVVVACAGIFIFADPLSYLIAPGFTGEKHAMVAAFTRVMLVAQILLAGSVIFGSVLQGLKRFFLYALAPILYNVGIIIGVLFFVPWFGIIGLAWGVVFGALLHFLLQTYGVMKAGYRYAWTFNWRDKDALDIIRLMGPRMVSIASSQIMFVVFTSLASTLAVGSVTVFQFAYNIQFFPIGIIGFAYAVAVFPTFAECLSRGEKDKFIRIFSSTVRQMFFLMLPMTLLFLIMRSQIVRVVVGAGAFDWTATKNTADVLAFFTLSFIAQSLIFILSRVFYALHDTMTPLVIAIVTDLLGFISALWFAQFFGAVGLAMAFSISAVVEALLLWVILRQRIGSLDEAKMVRSVYVMSTAAIFAGLVMLLTKYWVVHYITLDTFFAVLAQGFIAGSVGLVVYAVIAYALKSEELHDLLTGVKRRLMKKTVLEEPIAVDGS